MSPEEILYEIFTMLELELEVNDQAIELGDDAKGNDFDEGVRHGRVILAQQILDFRENIFITL